MTISLHAARTEAEVSAVRTLFERYAASLSIELGYQGFERELATLPARYAPPDGDLWLARNDATAVLGCVGLRPLGDNECELKRLFVLPEARGMGLGKVLSQTAIGRARELGYRRVRLDTLATMERAISLYGSLGFVRTEPYYAPTPPGTVFMALEL